MWTGFVAPADVIGARYCEDCHVAEVNDDPSAKTGVRSYALDSDRSKALWAKGEEMASEDFSTPQPNRNSLRTDGGKRPRQRAMPPSGQCTHSGGTTNRGPCKWAEVVGLNPRVQ